MKKQYIKKITAVSVSVMMIAAAAAGCSFEGTSKKDSDASDDGMKKLEETVNSQIPASTAKAEKDETVYIFTKADGKTDHMLVTEKLTNPEGKEEIEDETELTDVVNLSGDEAFTKGSGKELKWQANGAAITYQGKTTKTPPIGITITYRLNGKEVKPEEIAGKSGNVSIRYDYTNNAKQTVEVNGKKKEITLPYAVITGLVLPNDKFYNVTATNGKVLSEGDNTFAVGVATPGLSDSMDLKLDDFEYNINLPEYFEINAYTTDFELDMSVSAAMNNLMNEMNLNEIDLKSVEDKINQLKDGAATLKNGTETLKEGTGTLVSGTDSLKSGSAELNAGLKTLDASSGELSNGVTSLAEGAGKIKDGTDRLTAGEAGLLDGIRKYTFGTASVLEGAKQLSGGMTQLKEGTEGLKEGSTKAANGVKDYTDAVSTAKDGSKQLAGGTAQVSTGVNRLIDAFTGTTGVVAGTTKLAAGATQLNAGMKTFTGTLTGKLAAMNQSLTDKAATYKDGAAYMSSKSQQELLTEIVTASVTYANASEAAQTFAAKAKAAYASGDAAAVQSLSEKAEQNKKAAEAAAETISTVLQSAGASGAYQTLTAIQSQLQEVNGSLGTALTQLNNGTAELETGSSLLLAGLGKSTDTSTETVCGSLNAISAGSSTINSKMGELCAGITKLEGNNADLNSGMEQVKGGASQLSDGVDKVMTGAGALEAGLNELCGKNGELTGGMEILYSGSTQVADGVNTLKSGTDLLESKCPTLVSGVKQLYAGSGKLKDGIETLADGAGKLDAGALELCNGMIRFNDEGISKIAALAGDNVKDAVETLKQIIQAGKDNTSFAGKPDNMDGNVKFIYKTDEIKNKTEK